MILAIETSTPVCSVALSSTGRRAWEKRIEGRGVHSERLFTFTDELLKRAGVEMSELDAILFSRGPGSYTGLRIGASAIKGFLYGRDVPLYTFPTLFSFAAGLELTSKPCEIFSVIDARRSHLYIQKFK
jgi:tRNA threonylcarbamoyl adenosine modification protein YeaZ